MINVLKAPTLSRILGVLLIAVIYMSVLSPSPKVSAGIDDAPTSTANTKSGTSCGARTFLGLPAWDKYLVHEEIDGRCSPVINSTAEALPIGLAVLDTMVRIGGLVAVAMVFVGAFKFIASQGNPEDANSARKTIINAMIGLVIIILSTALVGFIGSRFV